MSQPEYRPVPYHRDRLSFSDAVHAAEEFLRTLRLRRSVRSFSRDPIPPQLIDLAIASAATAPSGANQQPWTFVVVTDPETKRRIREAAEEEERINYGGRMTGEWLAALAHLGTDADKRFLEIAPVLIVVFKQDYRMDGDTLVHHYYVNESVGIACGFLLAALNASGLATLTHTPSPMGFLREILGRPKNEKAFLLIPVGYPSAECEVPEIEKKTLDSVLVRIDP